MAIAKITRDGLIAISILVTILWGCIFAERRITRSAQIETYRALRQMRYLKFRRNVEPTAEPKLTPGAVSGRPVVG